MVRRENSAEDGTDGEGYAGTDQDVPSESDASVTENEQNGNQARKHAGESTPGIGARIESAE